MSEPLIAEGTGSSKKSAKQNACVKILNYLKTTGKNFMYFLIDFLKKKIRFDLLY